MLRWKYPGFSIDTSVRIREGRRDELEKLLCYIRRHPFRLSGFRYNREQKIVYYHASKFKGPGKNNFIVFDDPVELLEALAELIPHRKKHQVRYYGAAHPFYHKLYGLRPGHHPRIHLMPKNLFKLGRRRWARTLWLVYGLDALICKHCGRRMRLIAEIVDPLVIGCILRHLGLESSPPLRQPARAPPQAPEQRRLDWEEGSLSEWEHLDPLPPDEAYLDVVTELSSEGIDPLPPDELE